MKDLGENNYNNELFLLECLYKINIDSPEKIEVGVNLQNNLMVVDRNVLTETINVTCPIFQLNSCDNGNYATNIEQFNIIDTGQMEKDEFINLGHRILKLSQFGGGIDLEFNKFMENNGIMKHEMHKMKQTLTNCLKSNNCRLDDKLTALQNEIFWGRELTYYLNFMLALFWHMKGYRDFDKECPVIVDTGQQICINGLD